ncbi:1-acyl-sn-glycerol-3-phosphate acyltransferase [Leptospira perolatii]|uniref:1-acyl-sn-glycerol-3-phosphate acyltransferase n=1 Tax=Leptospira perolatii TaxID=2023191 RepID=A0A2M9ZR85_9LEPT|nr:lysophospholipid acyltransferase family protein [Leptospira perolatii]PJZ71013.1 1-acyl-sn-glycerol-3-phosphate acyltransferase [Leptospira perolatii]PJZ74545.1 1-acyl-sn-glycerol-3-phosphate acyltransferase [Leptospira perolatii]
MEKEAKAYLRIKNFVAPFIGLAVNITAHGTENIVPDGKLILVSNHRSDMDPFILSYTFPRFISWIAAEYTFRIPLFKDLAKIAGGIPMSVDGKISMASIKMIQQVFKRGDVLGIFPEGHDYMVKNDFSAPMVKFHEGFAAFSIRNKVDILPTVIIPLEESYSDIPIPPIVRSFMGMPKEVCDIKQRAIYKKVRVIYGEKVDHQNYLSGSLEENMKALSNEVRSRMSAMLTGQYAEA